MGRLSYFWEVKKPASEIYLSSVKPTIDFALACMVFVLALPLVVPIALTSMLSGLPVLFCHRRPGFHHKPFVMIKFCTIHPETGRINAFGRFLRKSSLDELPQVINILKGEMSFVGPRPLLMDYLERYTEEQKRRHLVKPGITGLAQVRGRNGLSLEEKLRWDLHYVDRVDWRLDLKVIIETFGQMFRTDQADGHIVTGKVLSQNSI